MKKLGSYIVLLVLVASTLSVAPDRSDDAGYFAFEKAYWGTNQPIEVSPGDVATLTVVLRYDVTVSFRNLEANLSLPAGFESVGEPDANTSHASTVASGVLVKLEFPLFITLDVEAGDYTAVLDLEYYISSRPNEIIRYEDELEIPFKVTGRPLIDATVSNDTLIEGEQQVLVELSNDGDATAKNLKIVKVSSSSALVELDSSELLGNLIPGDQVTVPLSLYVPEGMNGKILSLVVEASYLGPLNIGYSISETLQIHVEEVEEVTEVEVTITTRYPEVTVEAGKVVQYPASIANSDDADRLLFLSIEPPADWKVVFKSGVLEVSRLYLGAGQSENLVIEATPPRTVDIGAYTIPVRVKSEEGTIYAEMELKATIVGSYDLGLDLSTLLTSVASGSSTSFTARVTNTGQTSVTGIGLEVSVPEDWEFSISPVRLDLLGSRESFTFDVVVETPGNTVAGDYMVTLVGSSDQVESDQVQVRITVATPTEWGLYGVGVAVLFIVVLVLVFMKFKRR